VNDITEFQQRAAAVAVVKMLGGASFSICDLDAIAKTVGRESQMAGRDYAALRAVHCVAWADMGPELALMVREKCLELLGLRAQTVEMLKPDPQQRAEPAHEPAKRLRLAFWRT
jgi:hypothetical protein